MLGACGGPWRQSTWGRSREGPGCALTANLSFILAGSEGFTHGSCCYPCGPRDGFGEMDFGVAGRRSRRGYEMVLSLSAGRADLVRPLLEPLISAILPIFLEQWFSQRTIEILWRRPAGSQVDGCGNAEKDLGRSTESGFAGDMINGREIWVQRPREVCGMTKNSARNFRLKQSFCINYSSGKTAGDRRTHLGSSSLDVTWQ